MSIVKRVLKRMLPTDFVVAFRMMCQQKRQSEENKRIAEKNYLKIESLLRSSAAINLEFGSGENRGIAGWTYADINQNCDLTLDFTQPLPFPDGSVSKIYSSHLLEHFKYDDLMGFLTECRRILKPDGMFSAAVPNARLYLEGYQNPEKFDSETFCPYKLAYHFHSKIDYVNYIAYMDGHHHYMFDEENLVIVLRKAQFSSACLRSFDETIDVAARRFASIYVAAEK